MKKMFTTLFHKMDYLLQVITHNRLWTSVAAVFGR